MSEASEARAVAEALIQQVPYRDKLTELIKEHVEVYDTHCGYHAGCACDDEDDFDGNLTLDEGHAWYAEHLTKIIRGHLRQTRVVTAGHPSQHEQPCRCIDCYSQGGV